MSEQNEPRKVLLIGSSGCGKTTMFQFLTGADVHPNPPSTTKTHQATLKNHSDIIVVDTLGLESNDDEWWESLQDHQEINYGMYADTSSSSVITITSLSLCVFFKRFP
jgi:ethanolamine utilization protein EutP (predicted NTPase)